MLSEHHSLWFHGTNKHYLDDQLRRHGEYVGMVKKGQFGEERVGINLAENHAGMALVSALRSARVYGYSPIILVSSGEVLRGRLQMGNTGMKIYSGWPQDLFSTLDVQVVDMNDPFGYDGERFKDDLRKLLDRQRLFTAPDTFDWDNVVEYFEW